MLGVLAGADPRIDETFKEASRILGWDLLRLVREGPESELNRTQRTQPALLAASVAVWRAWRAGEPPQPALLAGHSLGEYTALVAAGSIDFGDALKLVELRGRLMQEAVPEGEGLMAAVLGADDAAVEKLCSEYPGPGVLEPANYNSPGQVVVAGSRVALDWLTAGAKTIGARRVLPLPMSVPSHCSLMRMAAARLGERLMQVDVRAPTVPVLHNIDAAPHPDPAAIRDALIGQLHHPVRWSQTVRTMAGQGIEAFLECGPGRVLTNLGKRILDGGQFVGLEDPDGMSQGLALLKGAAA